MEGGGESENELVDIVKLSNSSKTALLNRGVVLKKN